jgi:predicted N-acetyltransferase YhbS
MKRTFHDADFERLAEFWNKFAPERYRIDAELLRQKSVDCPVFDWGASLIEEADGDILSFTVVKKSAACLYGGPDKDSAHLTMIAFCDPQYGVDLLSDVKQTLRNRGCSRLVFGQDTAHLFPGCPTDFARLADFLMVEGFAEGGEAVDLERDLKEYANKFELPKDAEYRTLRKGDIPLLAKFLEREFPGRWRYDVLGKVEVEGPECVFALFRAGQVDGFALIQDAKNIRPIGGAVWRGDLGENWGSLGPIGVSKELRGRGYGHALLGEALAELRDRGARQTIIDWTGLKEFYGKHGFEVARTYRSMSLPLD